MQPEATAEIDVQFCNSAILQTARQDMPPAVRPKQRKKRVMSYSRIYGGISMPPAEVAAEFKKYNARLKLADRQHDKAERMHRAGKRGIGKFSRHVPNPHHTAEALYEKAIETLEELLSMFPGSMVWLDRPISFDCRARDGHYQLNQSGVPRVLWSRSQHRQR